MNEALALLEELRAESVTHAIKKERHRIASRAISGSSPGASDQQHPSPRPSRSHFRRMRGRRRDWERTPMMRDALMGDAERATKRARRRVEKPIFACIVMMS